MSWRVFRLTERHRRIDDALRTELRRARPDTFALMRLKRMKLKIKDALAVPSRQRGRA